jgi:acyl carrier protein
VREVHDVTRAEILQRLVELGRDVFDEEEFELAEDTAFEQVKVWDSLNHLRMVVAMERAFAIRFSIGDLQRVVRVTDLVDSIERLRQVDRAR